MNPDSMSSGTLEHIVPRGHGGGDDLENLAVACANCNHSKGHRLDHRRRDDPKLRAVIETLQARRRARWRDPPPELPLGPFPPYRA